MAEINTSAQEKYLQQKIEHATALGRVVILYEACIRFMKEAAEAFAAKKKVEACEKIIRAQNILRELRNALNMDLEPKVSGNFHRLYTFFLKQLSEANRTKSSHTLEFVIQQMTTLNDAWKQADAQGLGQDIKRYEDRMGVDDINILKRFSTAASPVQKQGLLETLNVRV